MKTTWLIVAVAVLAILFGGIWYTAKEDTVEELEPTPTPTPSSNQVEESPLATIESPVSAEQSPVVETAILAAISPYEGSGTATRTFVAGTFTHTVTANIGDPAAGKFYEGWLVMKTPSGPQFFSTGKMTKKENQYVLSYTATQNYPSHTDVVITEETLSQGLDGKPEAHVLEGTF